MVPKSDHIVLLHAGVQRPISLLQAMRAKEADHSAANSPAAVAERTTQATNSLLPRAFDCIRLMYANEPRAKPMHQVRRQPHVPDYDN